VPCVSVAGFVRVRRFQRETFFLEVSVNLFEQTTMVLEWPRLLEALAGHARSTMGAARCRALELATSLHDSQRRQQETTELEGSSVTSLDGRSRTNTGAIPRERSKRAWKDQLEG
jgi:hypothetical protein